MLVQLKSNPWLRVPIATLQFFWVALNNITGVFGYLCLYVCALPIKMFDKKLFDAIERNLYHITFYFCSSWGFENGWKMIVSGDVCFDYKIFDNISRLFLKKVLEMEYKIFSVRKAGKARGWKLHPCGQSPEYLWYFRPHVATCNSQRSQRRGDMDYGRDFQTFKLRMGLPGTRRFLHLATSWRKTVQICGSLRSWTYKRTWISSKSFFISMKKKIR